MLFDSNSGVYTLLILTSILTLGVIFKLFYSSKRTQDNLTNYKQKAIELVSRRNNEKYEFKEVDPHVRDAMLKARSIAELQALLSSKEATSVDLVTVFAQNCISKGRELNLVATEYFREALEVAH